MRKFIHTTNQQFDFSAMKARSRGAKHSTNRRRLVA
jgi:hypothetical protein